MLCTLLLSAVLAAVDVPADEIDAIFARHDGTDRPGCALAVIQDGEITYARGYGMANLEWGIAIGPDTIFRIGSTSKQFTAACVLLAEQEGLLSLDDDIRDYVPEIPIYAAPITVRHLVHHTSGLRDYLGLMVLAGCGDKDYYTVDDVLAMLSRQKALNFSVGERHLYSNSGYLLMGEIVERATGRSLREYAQEKIFGPLGMADTIYCDDTEELVPRRAEGYVPTDAGWQIGRTNLDLVGDGSVFTTVEDLARWDRNFYEPVVGGAALLEAQHRVGLLNDGSALTYAAGLGVDQYRGLRQVAHGGSFIGFNAQMMRFPDQRLTIICLSNDDSGNPSRRCTEVADLLLAEQFTEAAPERGDRARERESESQTEPAQFETNGLSGDYYSEELDVTVSLEVLGDEITYVVGHVRIGPTRLTSEKQAGGGGFSAVFERDEKGIATSFEIHMGRAQGIRYERVE